MNPITWLLEVKITPLVAITWYQCQLTSGIISKFCPKFKQIYVNSFASILYDYRRFTEGRKASLFNYIPEVSNSNLETIPNPLFARFHRRFHYKENIKSRIIKIQFALPRQSCSFPVHVLVCFNVFQDTQYLRQKKEGYWVWSFWIELFWCLYY